MCLQDWALKGTWPGILMLRMIELFVWKDTKHRPASQLMVQGERRVMAGVCSLFLEHDTDEILPVSLCIWSRIQFHCFWIQWVRGSKLLWGPWNDAIISGHKNINHILPQRWTTGKRSLMKSSSAYPKHFGLAVRKCQDVWEWTTNKDFKVEDALEEWAVWMLSDLPAPGSLAPNDSFEQIKSSGIGKTGLEHLASGNITVRYFWPHT